MKWADKCYGLESLVLEVSIDVLIVYYVFIYSDSQLQECQ